MEEAWPGKEFDFRPLTSARLTKGAAAMILDEGLSVKVNVLHRSPKFCAYYDLHYDPLWQGRSFVLSYNALMAKLTIIPAVDARI